MTRTFSCQYAEEITRREGPDIACNSTSANALCVEFFTQLKATVLPELGFEDDLTTMPASVLQKIQFGGLLGLYNALHHATTESIDNIHVLVEAAKQYYTEVSEFPYAQCTAAIRDYQLKRRRGR